MRPFRFLAPVGDVPDLPALTAYARRAEAVGVGVLVSPTPAGTSRSPGTTGTRSRPAGRGCSSAVAGGR